MDVGVRELKAHLSALLKRAQAGEVITITDRGRPTAVLAPLPGPDRVERGIKEGWIAPATAAGLVPVKRFRPRISISASLTEDRGA